MGRLFGRSRRNRTTIQRRWLRQVPQAIIAPPFVVGEFAPDIADDIYQQTYYGGYTYESDNAPIAPIYIEDTLQPTRASSQFPTEFDLKDIVFGTDPTKDSYDINIISIEEISDSIEATPWAEDNQFATVQRDRVSWTPRGTYIGAALRVRFEAADARHPPTPNAVNSNSIYTGDSPISPLTAESGNLPTEGEVILNIIDDILGDPEGMAKFWRDQGVNGTCMLESIAGILLAQGTISNADEVISRVTIGVDALGRYVILDENGDPRYDGNGGFVYATPENTGLVDILIDGEYPYIKFLEPPTGDFLEMLELNSMILANVDGGIFPNPNLQQNWDWVRIIFDTYDVPTHTGYASNFVTLMSEVEQGPVLVWVDGIELKRNGIDTFIHESEFVPFQFARTRENHALLVTGINPNADPPTIFLNDTGQEDGRQIEYPLDEFLSAFEDSNYTYQALGNTSPDPLQNERISIVDIVNNHLAEERFSDESGHTTGRNLDNYLQDEELVNEIERENPGFKQRVETYMVDVETQREEVLTDLGLDPDEIKKVYEDVESEPDM